jgi:hypothetical protein
MDYHMDKEKRNIQIKLSIMDSFYMEKSMEKVRLNFLMVQNTMENINMEKLRVKGHLFGQIVLHILDIGNRV